MPSKEQESVQSVTVDTSVANHQDMSQIVGQNGSKPTHACQPPPEKPTHPPYPATSENVPKLKQYILDRFSSSAFNTSSPFPSMDTTPAHTHF